MGRGLIVQHKMAKELLAGFAAAEVDKLFETKGESRYRFPIHAYALSSYLCLSPWNIADFQVLTRTTERRPSVTPSARQSRRSTSLASTRRWGGMTLRRKYDRLEMMQ